MDKIDCNSALKLLELPVMELVCIANSVRKKHFGNKIDLCCISNAKSGECAEDCRFCAQSSAYKTASEVYPLKSKKILLEEAKRARDIGADKFGIVTSGRGVSRTELDLIAEAINEIRTKIKIKVCASLGRISSQNLKKLKQVGLTRYHHNIETSRNFFPKIVSTHSFSDRITTIKEVKKENIEICSGGIIGMGETPRDRLEMAMVLNDLDVDSVPINILVPIKGTPLANAKQISILDVIKTICIFRIILKNKTIKIAAGREIFLKDFQGLAFLSGANGMLIGGYLTIKGREVSDDMELVKNIKDIWNG